MITTRGFITLQFSAWIPGSLACCSNPEAGVQTHPHNNFPALMPVGDPPFMDGVISPGEWDQAAVEAFADGSRLFLMQNGGYLYLGIQAIEPGTIAGNLTYERG